MRRLNYSGPNGQVKVNNTCIVGDDVGIYRQTNLTAGTYTLWSTVTWNWFVVEEITAPATQTFALAGDSSKEAWFLIDKRPSCTIAGPTSLYVGGAAGDYALNYAEPILFKHGEGY